MEQRASLPGSGEVCFLSLWSISHIAAVVTSELGSRIVTKHILVREWLETKDLSHDKAYYMMQPPLPSQR